MVKPDKQRIADLAEVVTVDAIAFSKSAEVQRPWLELLLRIRRSPWRSQNTTASS
jgi:hypothetical protein